MPATLVKVSDEQRSEARQLNELIEQMLAAAPSVHTVPPEETRSARAEGRGTFGPVVVVEEGQDRTIPGPAGDIPIRVFVPPTVKGAYLHIHGGGWVLGAANQQDPTLWRVAQEANVAVVSVDYRLAPEHPFPAGPDDCEAAALWFVRNAREEFGTDRLFIGGESAGGHLAALTLLRLRDRHGITGMFAAANLVFGAFDLGMTPSQRNWGDRNLILSTPIMAWFYDCFLPGLTSEERRDAEYSPLWADLRDMPPALFTVGDLDPLLDDSLFMAARWEAAGNESELQVYPESLHGFVAFPTAIGRMALDAGIDFVKKRV
ncbi:MAG TPA: alpha/beta hydrolase [Acidimicrobiales bacterium]|nr:alpha/beta hydrolase [Acidimicrobiales bacterium]